MEKKSLKIFLNIKWNLCLFLMLGLTLYIATGCTGLDLSTEKETEKPFKFRPPNAEIAEDKVETNDTTNSDTNEDMSVDSKLEDSERDKESEDNVDVGDIDEEESEFNDGNPEEEDVEGEGIQEDNSEVSIIDSEDEEKETTFKQPVMEDAVEMDAAGQPIPEKLKGYTDNREPSVPMSVPSEMPIRGVAGTKVERFFRTLSTEPVTYHYLAITGSSDRVSDLEIVEVYIALSFGKSYVRITDEDSDSALLQLSESTHYQMDLEAKTYEILPGLTTRENELSMDSFLNMEANATNFVDTGRGKAVFFGREVQFEEFTSDGESYIRYYFIGDVLVGHRTFKDGEIKQTVRIHEASNRYDEELFQLPEDLDQVGDTVVERNDK